MPYHIFSHHAVPAPHLRRLLLFICLFITATGKTQSIRDITTRDGLPQSFISGIVQDDSSFVWIASRNGLARFDGLQYKLFQHDPGDEATISSNIIEYLTKDSRNRLCIQTEARDIDIIDPVTEKVTHIIDHNKLPALGFSIAHKLWLLDVEDLLWCSVWGAGVSCYDKKNNKVTWLNARTAGLPNDTVRGLVQSRDNHIWLIGRQAISVYDRGTKKLSHWTIPYPQDLPASDYMACTKLHERKNGEIMWSDRTSLFFFNPANRQFRKTPLPAGTQAAASDIQTGYDGADYLETSGSVFRYDDEGGFRLLGSNFGSIVSFMVDRSGLIWLGPNGKGIRQIDLSSPWFLSQPYKQGFTADLLREHLAVDMHRLFHVLPEGQESISPNYLFRSAYAPGKLYLGLKETVVVYDKQQQTSVALPPLPAGTVLTGLTVTPSGRPVAVDIAGTIFGYQSDQRKWETLVDSETLMKKVGASFRTQDLLADDKHLWLATEQHGLIRITMENKAILLVNTPTTQVIGLQQDPRHTGLLWIGSYQGLICLDKQRLSNELISTKQGLPDNSVYAMLPDQDGNLWISTNKGLCRFNPATRQCRVFRAQHGLPGDEFNRHHQLLLPDGRLAFGGVEGWTVFDPMLMKTDAFDPLLAFTHLKINNREPAELPARNQPAQPLNMLATIKLPYEFNTLTIGFAALEYSQPHELHYRYQLKGYDDDWIQAGNNRQANYTKLPPGEYQFFVNATNTSGRWSSHVKSIKIIISPPWWATRLAYLCYTIILAGLVWAFIRLRVSRLLMEKEVELKDKEAAQLKELDDMKTRFFSNITHEFRTPLTLIMGPAEQLMAASAGDPVRRQLSELIIKNAQQLLNLVNRLLDLSRIEAKALKLREQEAVPGAIIGSIVHSFEMEAARRGIQLTCQDKTDGQPVLFFAEATERIVYNLVSNSLKFTPSGGGVGIMLEYADEHLQLTVRDTGIGIPDEQLSHIFDRFYQVGEAAAGRQPETGSGIGLAMVKELVEQMNGNITVESSTMQPAGTAFFVSLPYKTVTGHTTPAMALPADVDDTTTTPAKQLLLVEDNMELAGFITGILAHQYTVHHVTNGALGFEAAISLMPDVIITDIMMPVMDGMELLQKLGEDLRTDHIPVILLTAKTTREDLIAGLSGGAHDYLTKPFHPTELLLRVQNLLDHQHKIREKLQREISTPSPALLAAAEPVQDIFLTRLYELVDEHLDDPQFGVDQLAAAMNLSRSSLHRKLKALTGLSTTEVVRNYRLKKAAAFLLAGYNSSDTAYRSGFGSPAYFTKCFGDVYGMTPGDYIKAHRTAQN